MHSPFPGPQLWPLHLSFNEAARATLYKRKAGHVPPRLIPLTLKAKSSRLYTTWSHSYLHSITSALPCPPSPAAWNTFPCLQQAGHAPQVGPSRCCSHGLEHSSQLISHLLQVSVPVSFSVTPAPSALSNTRSLELRVPLSQLYLFQP